MSRIHKFIYGEGVTPLPLEIVFTLFLAIFFDGMTMISAFAYLPQLVKSFGVSEVETGRYSGILASVLYTSRVFSSYAWGVLADSRFGKKRSLLLSTTGIAISTAFFCFTTNFYWALVCRLFQGLFMGVIVISKSILGDITDDTNQTFAWTFIFNAYTIGCMVGPSLGGFLVFPTDEYPNVFAKGGFYEKYPIFLPNAIITMGFGLSISLLIYVLPKNSRKAKELNIIEQEEDEKNQNPESFVCCSINDFNSNEKAPLIEKKSLLRKLKQTKVAKLLRFKGYVSSCVLFLIYAFLTNGFYELMPVYAATIKEYNGLGMSSSEISYIYILPQPFQMIFNSLILPKVTNRFGTKKSLVASSLLTGILVSLYPVVGLIQIRELLWPILIAVQMGIGFLVLMSMVCINIFINNSVTQEFFGIANGLALSIASVGRAVGPTSFGSLFSWSLTNIRSVKGQKDGLGFPFDQFLPFLVMLVCSIGVTIYTYSVVSIDLETKSETREKKQTVTISHVLVG